MKLFPIKPIDPDQTGYLNGRYINVNVNVWFIAEIISLNKILNSLCQKAEAK